METQPVPVPAQPASSSKLWIAVLVTAVLTALVVGGGVYVWQRYINAHEKVSMQAEIDALNYQVENLLPVSPSPSANLLPITEVTAENQLEMYTNPGFGFSFQYPKGYTIAHDTLPAKPVPEVNGIDENLEITNNSVPEKPSLALIVNGAGFGPFFPDIGYDLLKMGNHLAIAKRNVSVPDENSRDGSVVIISEPITFGQNSYWFHFSFKEGGKDYEEDFKTILNSFKIE